MEFNAWQNTRLRLATGRPLTHEEGDLNIRILTERTSENNAKIRLQEQAIGANQQSISALTINTNKQVDTLTSVTDTLKARVHKLENEGVSNSGYVPYKYATKNLDLGEKELIADAITLKKNLVFKEDAVFHAKSYLFQSKVSVSAFTDGDIESRIGFEPIANRQLDVPTFDGPYSQIDFTQNLLIAPATKGNSRFSLQYYNRDEDMLTEAIGISNADEYGDLSLMWNGGRIGLCTDRPLADIHASGRFINPFYVVRYIANEFFAFDFAETKTGTLELTQDCHVYPRGAFQNEERILFVKGNYTLDFSSERCIVIGEYDRESAFIKIRNIEDEVYVVEIQNCKAPYLNPLYTIDKTKN